MISKLVIGTAQFSSNYGISNTSGKVKPDMAEKILRLANKSNIKLFTYNSISDNWFCS